MGKLSDNEQTLLGHIVLHADASLAELSKRTGLRPSAVRYALDSLLKRRVISRRVMVDHYKFGYATYGIWFSPSPGIEFPLEQAFQALIASSSIGYLGEFGGEYAYKIDIMARSPKEAAGVLQSFSDRFPGLFWKKTLCITRWLYDFPLRYLVPHANVRCAPVFIGESETLMRVDDTDRAILRELGSSDWRSHSDLARRLKIAPTTFDYRLKKLREQGAIVAYHYTPEVERLSALGLSSYLHILSLRSADKATYGRILDFAHANDNVYTLTFCLGEWDAEIGISCSSSAAARDFSINLRREFRGILKEVVANPIFRHLKANHNPFAGTTARRTHAGF